MVDKFIFFRNTLANKQRKKIRMSPFCNSYHKWMDLDVEHQRPLTSKRETTRHYMPLEGRSHHFLWRSLVIEKRKKNQTLIQTRLKSQLSIYRIFRGQRNMLSYTKGMQSAKPRLWETLQSKPTEFVHK